MRPIDSLKASESEINAKNDVNTAKIFSAAGFVSGLGLKSVIAVSATRMLPMLNATNAPPYLAFGLLSVTVPNSAGRSVG